MESKETKLVESKLGVSKPLLGAMLITLLVVGFSTGVHYGFIGPVLPSLAIVTGSNLEEASTIFTWRGGAAILGSLLATRILDKWDAFLVLGVALLLQAAVTATALLYPSLIVVSILLALEELLNCTIITGLNFMGFQLLAWGAYSGMMAQSVRILHQLGKGFAPFIASPFLNIPEPDVIRDHLVDIRAKVSNCEMTPMANVPYQGNNTVVNASFWNGTSEWTDLQDIIGNATTVSNANGVFKYSYIFLGSATAVLSILCFVMFSCSGCNPASNTKEKKKRANVVDEGANDPMITTVLIVALFAMYTFAFGGLEATYSGLIMAYVTEYLNWTTQQGVLISSLYQLCKVSVSLLTVPCAGKGLVLRHFGHSFGMTISGIVLILAITQPSCAVWFWVGSIALGLSVSAITPSTLSWLQTQYNITGKLAGVLNTAFCMGQMAVPPLASYTLATYGPLAFPLINCMCGGLCLIVFVFINLVIAFASKQRVNFKNKNSEKTPLLDNKG